MTDEQLLELLETKSPEELSPAEIQLVRQRIAESPTLAVALHSTVQMESHLAALRPVELSPEQIILRGQRQQFQRRQWQTLMVSLLVVLPLLALIGGVFWNAIRPSKEQELAQAKPTATEPSKTKEVSPASSAGKTTTPAGTPQPDAGKTTTPATTAPAPATTPGTVPPAVPAAVPVAPPAPAVEPWTATLADTDPQPNFLQTAFIAYNFEKQLTRKGDLEKWFEQVPGENYQIGDVDTSKGKSAQFTGIARLKAPWTADSALKISLENYSKLQIHCYHGETGVTLVYYEDQDFRWIAYATVREPGKARPQILRMTGSDDGRGRRTETRFGGPYELRYRNQEIILSRGDVVLVSAPLPGLPSEVYFEGKMHTTGISLVRTTDGPSSTPQLPTTYQTTKPAELPWLPAKLPSIVVPELLPDGSVRLASNAANERRECAVPLPQQGLAEIVLELDEVTPGTGVYLGYAEGKHHNIVRFLRDKKTNQTVALIRNWDNDHEFDVEPFTVKPVPFVGTHVWLKLLNGCGNLRWSISVDGQHWAQPEMAGDGFPPFATMLGLQVVLNRPDSHLRLKRIEYRELTGLTHLAPAELLPTAAAVQQAGSVGSWLAEVTRLQPAKVDAAGWRRACAIKTLGANCSRELGYALLELLLDDAAARKLPLEAQLAALNDTMRLCWDLRSGGAMKVGMLERYMEVGLAQFEEQGTAPWTAVRQASMAAPQMTWLQTAVSPEKNIRWELIQALYNPKPEQASRVTEQVRFFHQLDNNPLIDWGEAVGRQSSQNRTTGEKVTRFKDGWRHPWLEDLSKESYSSLAELRSVLESQSWEDAARMVASLGPDAAEGMAPTAKDPNLFTSLPVAVQMTMLNYPALKNALTEKFGAVAKLRISQAIASGDAATAELATIQFAGTEAAADAYRWLGDRALAEGEFERAMVQYELARTLLPALSFQIDPRERLTQAMLGRDVGKPIARDVSFGEARLTAAQFEQLVAEMRARGNLGVAPLAQVSPPEIPAPTTFKVDPRSRLDGNTGVNPQEEVDRRTNQYRIPWVDRQIATAAEGDLLYVSNRFQLAAYNLTNGQRVWQSPPPPGPMQKSQDWACIAMRPLLTANLIFARQMYGTGPQLVCFEKATGKISWSSDARPGEFFVSDPVIIQGKLGALSMATVEQQEGILRWNLFDPLTGELRAQRDLVRLRNTWGKRACCEVLTLPDGLVAVLGGLTLNIDPRGNLNWVRRQKTLPADEDPRWIMQTYERPLLQDGLLYISQPGVRTVDCLNVQTGEQKWQVILPEVLGVVGLSQGRLIVRCEGDMRGLDPQTGKMLWKQITGDLHSQLLLSEKALLWAQREPVVPNNGQLQNRLVWLDPATGNYTASSVLPNLNDADPRLGPLVVYKDRLFSFFGRGQHEPTRDVVELTPAGPAEKMLDSSKNIWLRHLPANQVQAVQKTLPEWRLISTQAADRTGIVADAHGERDILGLRSSATAPVVLGRALMLPAGSQPKLRVRLGSDPGTNYRVEVRLGDKLDQAIDVTDATHPDRFKNLEFDLAPLAGQSGWLSLQIQWTAGGDGAALFIKSLEVVF